MCINSIKHSKKTRRGGRKLSGTLLKVISTNSQGDKFLSLASLVKVKKASVFVVQETQARKKGKHQLEHFVIYESKRSKIGGGSMMGFHESLNPVLVTNYENEFELMVVEIKIGKKEIRFLTGYGPQEDWGDDLKAPFFVALNTEIAKALAENKSLYIAMDANCKLGPEYIPGDPNKMSKNGEILSDIVDRNALIVVNGLVEKCEGVITRQRSTEDGRIEKSAIDLVIVSGDLEGDFESLKIDEERKNVLTKIVRTRTGKESKTESDHNILEGTLNIKVKRKNIIKKEEMYNLKNTICQKLFKEHTTNPHMAKIFDSDKHVDILAKKLLNAINGAIVKCFRKIRSTKSRSARLVELYSERTKLNEHIGKNHESQIADIERQIADEACDIISDETNGLESESGGYNPGHLWRLKDKIIPKPPQVPTAMKGADGNLLTSKGDLKKATVDHFSNVLRNREIRKDLKEHKQERDDLCATRLKTAKHNKTPAWTEEDLLIVLKGLKNKKSRDPNAFANEIFDPSVAGKDLIEAILALMNRIKQDQVYPKCMQLCTISSLYKQKGPVNDFNSYRGIFRVQALRNILERLIYNDEYELIDSNLTDCNVGARKGRNIRDNIFVLNAIMNDSVNGTKEAIDIGIYDAEKCFDSLWLEECINDIYDAGLKNDKLNLLYLMNKNAQVVIKTPWGLTERKTINNIVMQGTVWGSLFCTATMDKLGKLKYSNKEMLYKYKSVVGIPALEMVDDVVDVQKCGVDAVKSNAVVNSFMEHKKLTLSKSKCHKIHCGKKSLMCPELEVHKETMHVTDEDKYLGDHINKNAKHATTVSRRRARGFGIISDIMQIIDHIKDSKRRIKVGLHLRQAWFINSLLVNVEAWHNVLKKDTDIFTNLDNYLMKKILGAQSKVPTELLFLETGAIPVRFILTSRRANFFHNILKREENELVKRVYNAQKENPSKGDWIHIIKEDMELINLNMTENEISSLSKNEFKKHVKLCVTSASFTALKSIQEDHIKIQHIKYNDFKLQPYLTSELFTYEEASTLFNMRANTVNGFKKCFPTLYANDIQCKLGCSNEDSISHILTCTQLGVSSEVSDTDIFGSTKQQHKAVTVFLQRCSQRSGLLADRASQGLQGQVLDTSTLASAGGARTSTGTT